MAIVDALNASDGVAEHALGDVGPDVRARHEGSRGSPEIMNVPRCKTLRQTGVEPCLSLGKAPQRSRSSASEDMRIARHATLRTNHVERKLGKDDAPGVALLPWFSRYRPFAIVADVGPAHR